MNDDDPRIGAVELQAIREWLGLSVEALAEALEVAPRTVRTWETGKFPIPPGVRAEVRGLEAATDDAVRALVAGLVQMDAPTVTVYRTDGELYAVRPGGAHETARWWRHVVARAAREVPGLRIESAADNRE